MSTTPTLLLVHGAFHRREMWDLTVRRLPDIDVRTVQLPSSAPVPVSRLGDLYDDARAVREAALAVDGPVVVCAHSYGAVPVTQGLAGVDTVKRLVYLHAFLLDVGESMLGNRGGTYPPHWIVDEERGCVEIRNPRRVFYSDLAPEAAQEAVAALGPQSLAAPTQPLTQAPWHTIPSTYVAGDGDNAAVPAAMREKFSARASRVRRMRTAHSPFLSHADETAAMLRAELTD